MSPVRRNVPVLCGTIFCTLTGIYLWYRLFPVFLREELGATSTKASLAFAALLLAHRLPQFVGGWLADRFSRRWVVSILTLAMAPLYWAAGGARSWEMCTLWLGLCWVLSGLTWPGMVVLTSDSSAAGARGRAIGALDFFILVGMTAGPLLGALAFRERGWGARELLRVTAVIYVAVAAARAAFLREPPRAPKAAGAEDGLPGGLGPVLLVSAAGWAAYHLVSDTPFTAQYLRDMCRLGDDWINGHAFLCGGLAAVGAVASGWLVDRAGPARTLAITFAAWAAALLPLLLPGVPERIGGRFPFGPGFVLLALTVLPAEMFVVAYFHWVTKLGGARGGGRMLGAFGTVMGIWGAAVLAAASPLYEVVGITGPAALAVLALAVGQVPLALGRGRL